VLSSLHKQLMLLKTRQANPKATLPELAEILNWPVSEKDPDTTSDYDRSTGSAVSRSLALAKMIVTNVGLGRFPDNGRSKMQNLVDQTSQNK
jgi:hypothetical protein